jgi:hypothetical protein
MPKLTARDIKERSNNLRIISETPASVNIKTLFRHVKSQYSYNNAKIVLENWRGLSRDESVAFQEVLELFQLICDNDSPSHIKNASELIEGKILHKVRDGKALRHLNNYKMGKHKIANTKIEKQTHANATVTTRDLENKGHHVNTLHPNRKYKYDMFNQRKDEAVKKNTPEGEEGQEEKTPKEKMVEECYNRMIECVQKNQQCDRVIDNHDKLSKRFNLDKIVRECRREDGSYRDCIFELCSLIDSYDIAVGAKYGIALENIMYLMNKNCIPLENSFIAEAVTDYFLLNNQDSEEFSMDDLIHDMKYVVENSKFYDDDDFAPIAYIFDEDYESITTTEEAIDTILEFHSDKHKELIRKDENGKKIKPTVTKVKLNGDKKNTIKGDLNAFKMSHNKSIQTLKKCLHRVFCNSPENIVKELPDIFAVVRGAAVIGMFAFSPFLGIFGLITGAFLKMDISRKQMKEVVDAYDKEISRYKDKLNKTKDEKSKQRYKEYIKKLEADRDKLEAREDTLYTDEEVEKKREERYEKRNKDSSSSDDDFDFGSWDEMYKYLDDTSVLVESMNWDKNELMNTIRRSINYVTADCIPVLTEAVILNRDIFDVKEYASILEYERHRLRSENGYGKYAKIDPINLALADIAALKEQEEDDSIPDLDIISTNEYTHYVQETVQDVLELLDISRTEALNESSLSNKVKLAADKLGKTAVKLKDKDRKISKDIDVTMGHFAQAAERALTNDRREAIIKGSLIPSASKTIKAALVTGAAWLVSPAIAVIGVLGAIGTSKKLQKKERQIILDDIEIELKMCDKYMRLAEDRNDLKAVRSIMQTQRALERQRSRLRYNMKVNWNEKAPTTAGDKSYDEAVNFEEKYIGLPGVIDIKET